MVAHIVTDSAHREAMVTIAFDLSTVSKFGIDSIVFMNVVTGVMKMRIRDRNHGSARKSFDAFFNFSGDYWNMKRSAAFLVV